MTIEAPECGVSASRNPTGGDLPRPNPPFRQGKFDALCGIYAIVNAFAYARRHDPIRYFPHRTLFAELIGRMARLSGAVSFVTEGISYREMDKLLKHAKRFYAERGHHFEIVKPSKLFERRAYPKRARDLVAKQAWMHEASALSDTAVILDVHTPWIWHWSVLTLPSKDPARIGLHDSFGMRSVAIEHVQAWRVVRAY